jgi:sarcosine oxidase subunit delta
MLLVPCPVCGPKNAAELTYRGETHSRPDPNQATPEEWRSYLYLRDNPAGWLREGWFCSSGCRTFFTLERNTTTGELREPLLPGNKVAGRPISDGTEP